MKRAITLAGGGPAVGLSIGTLKRLKEEEDIHFDVWATACIGSWLGVVYNQCDEGKEIEQTIDFFKKIFVRDDIYSRFPIATAFAPDWQNFVASALKFTTDPKSYHNLVVPDLILEAAENLTRFAFDPRQWTLSNWNQLILNDMLRVSPISRFWTSFIWQGSPNGLSQIYYPDSALLNQINFKRLYEEGKPSLYHNAYNLTDQRLELFGNRDYYQPLTAKSLCACSALPFIEQTVEIDGKTYCEGATVDTVNFEHLMKNYPDLEEVWVSRILDRDQIHKPDNLYDALNNLVMLFAATTSEDDVKLFKAKIKEHGYKVKVVEIPVAAHIDYNWSYGNLETSIEAGYRATSETLKSYRADTEAKTLREVS